MSKISNEELLEKTLDTTNLSSIELDTTGLNNNEVEVMLNANGIYRLGTEYYSNVNVSGDYSDGNSIDSLPVVVQVTKDNAILKVNQLVDNAVERTGEYTEDVFVTCGATADFVVEQVLKATGIDFDDELTKIKIVDSIIKTVDNKYFDNIGRFISNGAYYPLVPLMIRKLKDSQGKRKDKLYGSYDNILLPIIQSACKLGVYDYTGEITTDADTKRYFENSGSTGHFAFNPLPISGNTWADCLNVCQEFVKLSNPYSTKDYIHNIPVQCEVLHDNAYERFETLGLQEDYNCICAFVTSTLNSSTARDTNVLTTQLGFCRISKGKEIAFSNNDKNKGCATITFPSGTGVYKPTNYLVHMHWDRTQGIYPEGSGVGLVNQSDNYILIYDYEKFKEYVSTPSGSGWFNQFGNPGSGNVNHTTFIFCNSIKIRKPKIDGVIIKDNALPVDSSTNVTVDIINNTYNEWNYINYNTYNNNDNRVTNNYYYPMGGGDNPQYGDIPSDLYNKIVEGIRGIKLPNININLPTLPTLSPYDKHYNLYTIWLPSTGDVNKIGSGIWSNDAITIIKELFSNPIDCIITYNRFFLDLRGAIEEDPVTHEITGGGLMEGSERFHLGRYQFPNVQDPTTGESHEFNVFYTTYTNFKLDCGTIAVPNIYGDARDYNSCTTIELFLPFIGFVQLDPHDVMGRTLKVVYNIDITTGSCIALIYSWVKWSSEQQCLYSFTGNCAVTVPLTSANYSRVLSGMVGTVGGTITSAIGVATGNPLVALGGIGGAIGSAMGSQVGYAKCGNFNGNIGAMTYKKPYIVIRRMSSIDANNFNEFYGYPSNKTIYLRNLKGFTRVKDIHLDIASATDVEKNEIESLLKNGVIL